VNYFKDTQEFEVEWDSAINDIVLARLGWKTVRSRRIREIYFIYYISL
jgi:hypothetical protein